MLAGAPKMVDYLDEDCAAHFKKLQDYLIKLGIEFTLDPPWSEVRLLHQNRVRVRIGRVGRAKRHGGGGRYDNLSRRSGGRRLRRWASVSAWKG